MNELKLASLGFLSAGTSAHSTSVLPFTSCLSKRDGNTQSTMSPLCLCKCFFLLLLLLHVTDNPLYLTKGFESQYLSSKQRRERRKSRRKKKKRQWQRSRLSKDPRCSSRIRRQWHCKGEIWSGGQLPLPDPSLQGGKSLSAPNHWDPFRIYSWWLPQLQCQTPRWSGQLRPCLFDKGTHSYHWMGWPVLWRYLVNLFSFH